MVKDSEASEEVSLESRTERREGADVPCVWWERGAGTESSAPRRAEGHNEVDGGRRSESTGWGGAMKKMGGSVMEFDGFLNLASGRWTEQNKEKGVRIVNTGSDEMWMRREAGSSEWEGWIRLMLVKTCRWAGNGIDGRLK